MNPHVYNASVVVGLALVGVGIGLRNGLPDALAVVGALVLLITAFGAHLATRRGPVCS
jgi:hypothetical protein